MSRRRKVLLIWAALVIVLALLPVIAHYRAKAAAEKFKAQLRAQGEKLSIGELVSLLPVGTPNGARDFLDALSRLTSFDYELQPGVMRMVQPGRARIAWQQPTLPTDKSEDIWPALRAHLETNRAALADLRAAVDQPVLQFQVNYHLGISAQLPHLGQTKSASQRLSAAAIMAMRDQRTDEAFANLQALVTLPAHYRESYLISQLIRCAFVAIAASATWEALHYHHWSEEQLATLQAAWELVQTIPQMEQALAMERACVLVEYDKARESLNRLGLMGSPGGAGTALQDLGEAGNKLMEDPAEGVTSLIGRFPLRWAWKWWNSYHDEIWFLESIQESMDIGRAMANGQPFVSLQNKVKKEMSRIEEPPIRYLFARLLGGAGPYHKAMDKAVIAETQRRVVVTAVALERYKRRSGNLPAELTALVPKFLSVVPIDPMDGEPLRYRHSGTNSFLLYSIGLDGVDGDGDTSPKEPGSKTFYWTQCKDFVWPQPATVEQLHEFNSQLEQKRGTTRR